MEIDCPDTVKFGVINRLKTTLIRKYDDVNTLDGIRVDLGYGWVLIRASNSTPLIRLTIEAENESQIEELTKIFKDEIEKIMETSSTKEQ